VGKKKSVRLEAVSHNQRMCCSTEPGRGKEFLTGYRGTVIMGEGVTASSTVNNGHNVTGNNVWGRRGVMGGKKPLKVVKQRGENKSRKGS